MDEWTGNDDRLMVMFHLSSGRIDRDFINFDKNSEFTTESISLLEEIHEGAEWFFYENGTFIFIPSGIGSVVSDSLSPVEGRYKIIDNEIQFHGSGSFTGFRNFVITGRVHKYSDGSQSVSLHEEIIDDSNRDWSFDFKLPIANSNSQEKPVLVEKEAKLISEQSKSEKQIDKSTVLMHSVKKILILSSNPKYSTPMRLDENLRDIEEGLRRSKKRERYDLKAVTAVRHRDFRRALLDYEPHIVHFMGHGKEEGLLVEDKKGFPKMFSKEALSGLFELCAEHVECVILSACYSEPQGKAISQHIQYVVGMKEEIMEEAALEFSVGFYDALGAGKSIETAFKFGKAAIMAVSPDQQDHSLIPVLIKGKDSI